MLNRIMFRRVSQLALTLLAIVALAATLTGCSASSSTGGTGSASTGSSSSATASSTVGQQQTLPFDHAASLAGRPRRAAESTLNVAWFPPDPTLLTGLRQLTDKKKIAELAKAASGNAQFWIELPNNHAKPIVFGSEAVSILSTSTGFSTALIVPVRAIGKQSAADKSLAADLKATPTAYQVLLSGDVGETSFGLRKGSKPGEWLLDPNGELVNWGNAIDAVGRDATFAADQAYVTHSAFDLGGRPALFVSWAVFRNSAKNQEYAVALHNPPALNVDWTIAGKPLRLATAYAPATVYGPVVLTPKPAK